VSRQSVLFVCTANICRSPLAEAVMQKFLHAAGVVADIGSAGTHDYFDRMPPYPLAVATAKRRGYDITGATARRIRPFDFRYFDLIVAMDRTNISALRRLGPEYRQKVRLLMDYATLFGNREVPDPYGGGVVYFERCLDLIEEGCRGLGKQIIARAEAIRIPAVQT
jgi:protein-tyrosine phosphatase